MHVHVDELRALNEQGATIINVGKHAGASEIRGAMRYLPHDLLGAEHLALPIAPDRPVVLYDEDGHGDLTEQIAEKLRGNGFSDVRILDGGFRAWERSSGPTQEPSLEQVVPPSRASEVQSLDRRI
jgi:3-mercaptopyruvate sulfurtransferase SseA